MSSLAFIKKQRQRRRADAMKALKKLQHGAAAVVEKICISFMSKSAENSELVSRIFTCLSLNINKKKTANKHEWKNTPWKRDFANIFIHGQAASSRCTFYTHNSCRISSSSRTCLLNAHFSLDIALWKLRVYLYCLSSEADVTLQIVWELGRRGRDRRLLERGATHKSIGWRSETWGMCCAAIYMQKKTNSMLKVELSSVDDKSKNYIHNTRWQAEQKKTHRPKKKWHTKWKTRSQTGQWSSIGRWRESHSSNVNASTGFRLKFDVEAAREKLERRIRIIVNWHFALVGFVCVSPAKSEAKTFSILAATVVLGADNMKWENSPQANDDDRRQRAKSKIYVNS